jgi:hypothetical protein
MSKLNGNRQLLAPVVPFLIGAYANRVAPSHVFNAFLAAGFGSGSASQRIAKFIRDANGTSNPPPHLAENITSNSVQLRLFAESLVTILDPDHRVFPSGGSPFPICPSVISQNPSDDQFGSQLGALCGFSKPDYFDMLSRIYDEQYVDPIALLGTVLNDGNEIAKRKVASEQIKQLMKSSGALSRNYFEALAALVHRSTVRKYGTLSAQLVTIGRGVYFAAFLASLRAPIFLARKPNDWRKFKPLFVYGERPPGNSQSAGARLAIRSYRLVMSDIQNALGEIISQQLEKSSGRIPRKIPKSSRTATWIKLAFPEMKSSVEEQLREHIRSANELKNIRSRIVDAIYPIEYLSRAYRTIGRMLGFVGPDRGAGNPRFLLETPVLGALVESTMEEGETMSFEDWIDRVYERFGLVLGFGRTTDPRELLSELDRPNPLIRAIQESQDALRLRLVLAGLAVEYSDGETEMINQSSFA